jgi:hypothetical protein
MLKPAKMRVSFATILGERSPLIVCVKFPIIERNAGRSWSRISSNRVETQFIGRGTIHSHEILQGDTRAQRELAQKVSQMMGRFCLKYKRLANPNGTRLVIRACNARSTNKQSVSSATAPPVEAHAWGSCAISISVKARSVICPC